MKVCVVGCGYVGLVSAVGLAAAGHEVVGVEVDDRRRAAVEAGRAPFHEPGLEPLLREGVDAGRLRFTGDIAAAGEADVILLAVQTPPRDDGSVELRFLADAATAVAGVLAAAPPRRRVVAVRSTVVPGTAETVVSPIVTAASPDVAVASNPEFLREGSAVDDFLHGDRVVVGCDEPWAADLLRDLYAPLQVPVVVTTPSTAELAKYSSNALLSTLISFSNEIGRIAEGLPGVDVEDVLGILYRDRRLTPIVDGTPVTPGILGYLKAGCGYGGSCLPKDLSALVAVESARGTEHPLLEAVREVNETQPGRLVDTVGAALGGLEGRTVGVLGLAFKGGTDDLRASPGLRIVDELLDRGAAVVGHDPLVAADAVGPQVERGLRVLGTVDEVVREAAAVVVASSSPEFRRLEELARAAGDAMPLVVDGRRFLDRGAFSPERFRAVGLGPSRAG